MAIQGLLPERRRGTGRSEKVIGVLALSCAVVSGVGAGLWWSLQHYSKTLSDVFVVSGVVSLVAVVGAKKEAFDGAKLWSGVSSIYGLAKGLYVGTTQKTPWAAWLAWSVVLSLSLGVTYWAHVGARIKRAEQAIREETTTDYEAMPEEEDPEEDETKKKKKKALSLWTLVVLLRAYYWPKSWMGRVAVLSTYAMVALSKATSILAPLMLSTAANAISADDANPKKAALYAVGYGALTLASKIFKESQSLCYLRVGKHAFVELATDNFAHVHALSLHWHLSKRMGEVVRVVDRGISGADSLMRYGVLYIGPSLAECLAICFLFYFHFDLWQLTVLVFTAVAIYSVLTVKLTLWRKRFRARMNASDNKWHDVFTESLTAFETVKVFTAQKYEERRFGKAITSYQSSSVHVQASLSFLNIVQQVILCATLAGSLIITGTAVSKNRASVGAFVAVNVWVVNLFTPLNFLGTVWNTLVQAVVDLRNLAELLAEQPLVVDAPDAIAHPNIKFGGGSGLAVSFSRVKFDYPGANRTGLTDVSFNVDAGASLGIVGNTGAGKSTIGRLLFRFYDVDGGSILVGGLDVRKTTQDSLRKLIGVVPQDCVLFNDSIAYNILYGDPTTRETAKHLTSDDPVLKKAALNSVVQAATRAHLHDFVQTLPEGYHTVVGERGLKLSGGEKQRVAIARLFVKNPPVALFDEATSALDSRTERSILASLEELAAARTTLTIAHRLSTIVNCDQILVLADGAVAEIGSHSHLLALQGEYAAMWNAQQADDYDLLSSLQPNQSSDDETKHEPKQ